PIPRSAPSIQCTPKHTTRPSPPVEKPLTSSPAISFTPPPTDMPCSIWAASLTQKHWPHESIPRQEILRNNTWPCNSPPPLLPAKAPFSGGRPPKRKSRKLLPHRSKRPSNSNPKKTLVPFPPPAIRRPRSPAAPNFISKENLSPRSVL